MRKAKVRPIHPFVLRKFDASFPEPADIHVVRLERAVTGLPSNSQFALFPFRGNGGFAASVDAHEDRHRPVHCEHQSGPGLAAVPAVSDDNCRSTEVFGVFFDDYGIQAALVLPLAGGENLCRLDGLWRRGFRRTGWHEQEQEYPQQEQKY